MSLFLVIWFFMSVETGQSIEENVWATLQNVARKRLPNFDIPRLWTHSNQRTNSAGKTEYNPEDCVILDGREVCDQKTINEILQKLRELAQSIVDEMKRDLFAMQEDLQKEIIQKIVIKRLITSEQPPTTEKVPPIIVGPDIKPDKHKGLNPDEIPSAVPRAIAAMYARMGIAIPSYFRNYNRA